MTAQNPSGDDARALRVIEALHGQPEDIEVDPPADPAALARIQASAERAFDLAWRAAREHAKAQAAARPQRRHDLLTLARDAIVAAIHAWQERLGPSLQLAHRDLDALSDDDLRTMLADLEDLAERRGDGA
jgi:hypothetical protein